jgi:hypothetical protein
MAKKPIGGLTAAMLGHAIEQEPALPAPASSPTALQPPATAAEAGSIALTVKVSSALYQRLKFHGVRRRQSNQAILQAALIAYLDREEGAQ